MSTNAFCDRSCCEVDSKDKDFLFLTQGVAVFLMPQMSPWTSLSLGLRSHRTHRILHVAPILDELDMQEDAEIHSN